MQSTLFPKITNKLYGVRMALANLPGLHKNHSALKEIVMIGSVKLHGAHADIVIDAQDNVTFQSRNRTDVSIEADNHGFAAAMTPNKPSILGVKKQILLKFEELNPEVAIDNTHPLIIAGEYIGEGIMKKVAICELWPMFVILSISINGVWQPTEAYADVHDESADIFNISRGGFFRRTVNLIDPEESFEDMMVLTRGVEYRCPFAMSFGIVGAGEGLIWKPEKYQHIPSTWLKTKGESFLTSSRTAIVPKEEKDKRKKVAAFARAVLTPRRYQQGVEYMKEMRIPREMHNVGTFIEWVANDVLVEEHWAMEVEGIDPKRLRVEINRRAKAWFDDNTIFD